MDRLVYFIRHGESEANVTRTFSNRDLPHHLTRKGVDQAEALAAALIPEGLDALYASPVPRALETAAIVAKRLGLECEPADALREFDVGRFEGTASPEGWAEYAQVVAAWQRGEGHRSVGGGESLDQLASRFLPFIRRLIADPSAGNRIAIVSHGGVLHSCLPLLVPGLTPEFTWAHGMQPTESVLVSATDPPLLLRWCAVGATEEVAQSN